MHIVLERSQRTDQRKPRMSDKIDGSYNLKRWNVSVSSCNKTDDGTYIIIGKRRPVRPLRHTKTKTDNVRRLPNQRTCNE